MQAALPMGNNKITGLATPTVATDGATKAYVDTFPIPARGVKLQNITPPGGTSNLLGTHSNAAVNITAAANNGAGLIRLTVSSTTGYLTGSGETVYGVTGTTEANGRWGITVIDATHIDLQGSAFVNTYISGGTIGGGLEAIALGSGLTMLNATINADLSAASLPGYLSGLTLSTTAPSSAFTIAAGAANDVASGGLMLLAAALTKNTSSWVVGSAGALDTGSVTPSTGYHVFLIKRTDTGVVDVLLSLSATAPTMPASYTLKRRIGWMKTNGSSQWVQFYQTGDEFLWDVPVVDVNAVALGASVLYPLSVPTGVNVKASFVSLYQSNTAGSQHKMWFPSQTGAIPIYSNVQAANATAITPVSLITDTSGQIRASSNGVGVITWTVTTLGWTDTRGK